VSRRGRIDLVLLAVVAVALALRLSYLHDLGRLGYLTGVLSPDELYYDQLARRVAEGRWLGDAPFFYGPLYPYLLGLLYAIAGPAPATARAVQLVLGALACVPVFWLGRRLFDRRVGLLAAAATALYGPWLLLSGSLLYDQLAPLLVTLFLLAALRARESGRPRDHATAGVLLGLAALGRANVLLWLPVAVLLAWREARVARSADPGRAGLGDRARGRGPAAGAASRRPAAWRAWETLVLACGLTLAPAALHNLAAGDAVPLTTNGGLNFLIGNGPDATGGFRQPAGLDLQADPTGLRAAEAAAGRELRPSEASAHFLRAAGDHARAHPGAWLALLARKVALFWNAHELAQIENYEFQRAVAPTLRRLPPPFGWLAPLALVGLAVAWRRGGAHVAMGAFLAAYTLSIALFFVAGRYRLAVVPLVAIYAAAALVWAGERLRERAWRPLLAAAAAAAALAVLLGLNLLGDNPRRHLAETHFRAGRQAEERRLAAPAVAHHRAAVAAWPAHAKAWLSLGVALSEQGDKAAAESAVREAVRRDPGYGRAYYNLALLVHGRGAPGEAIALLQEATRRDPDYYGGWRGLAVVLAAEGRLGEARTALARIAARPWPGEPEGERLRERARQLAARLAELPEGARPAFDIDPARLAPDGRRQP
jgi:4-amino-4-deoxy-L-arabinose transferase-like glycosyltransferase